MIDRLIEKIRCECEKEKTEVLLINKQKTDIKERMVTELDNIASYVLDRKTLDSLSDQDIFVLLLTPDMFSKLVGKLHDKESVMDRDMVEDEIHRIATDILFLAILNLDSKAKEALD